jgi:hypothetical protein
MHERLFVLAPLLELEADPPLPAGRTIHSLRLGPAALSGVRPVAPGLRVGEAVGRSDVGRAREAWRRP